MDKSIQVAALFNQSGASYLISNQPELAVECFQKALTCVTSPVQALALCIAQSQQEMMSQQKSVLACREEDTDGYLYSKPFFFNPTASITEEEILPCGGVIMFNLAISYHRRGSELDLATAIKLYDRCLSLVRFAQAFDCSNVIIAALHNKARAYEDLCDYNMARAAFQMLAKILQSDGLRTDTMDSRDLQEVCLSIYFFKVPTCAAIA